MVYAQTSHNKRYTLRRLFGGSGFECNTRGAGPTEPKVAAP